MRHKLMRIVKKRKKIALSLLIAHMIRANKFTNGWIGHEISHVQFECKLWKTIVQKRKGLYPSSPRLNWRVLGSAFGFLAYGPCTHFLSFFLFRPAKWDKIKMKPKAFFLLFLFFFSFFVSLFLQNNKIIKQIRSSCFLFLSLFFFVIFFLYFLFFYFILGLVAVVWLVGEKLEDLLVL